MHRLRHSFWKVNARFYQVFTCDVQGIKDDQRNPFHIRVQGSRNGFAGVAQHAGELVHRNHIVVPGELVGLGGRGPGGNVVEVAAHHQGPGIVQALQRIRPRAQPFRGERSFLRSIGQQLFFSQPALLVALRRQ